MVRLANDTLPTDYHKILTRLRLARTQPNVRLEFKDGRSADGAITFVERLGTGRLINIDSEVSVDFHIYDLQRVVF